MTINLSCLIVYVSATQIAKRPREVAVMGVLGAKKIYFMVRGNELCVSVRNVCHLPDPPFILVVTYL
jgi:hypothetical protein